MTDAFTTAANDEAERSTCTCEVHSQDSGGGHTEYLVEYDPACPEHSEHVYNPRTGVWEWARDHLAAQEPTDAECVAVLNVKYGGAVGPHDEPYDAEEMAEARAALTAARETRHG